MMTICGHEAREIVGQRGGDVGLHGAHVEQPVEDRDDDAEQAEGVAREPVEEGVDQADAVDQRQAVAEPKRTERAAADLREAQRPAAALGDVFLQAFGGEAERQPLVEIDGAIALDLQAQREQVVFGDGPGGQAADLPERRRSGSPRTCRSRTPRPRRPWRPSRRRRNSAARPATRATAARLLCIGSGLMKCCGVCTMPTSSSRNSDSVRSRKFGIGTKSASRMAMKSGGSVQAGDVQQAVVDVAGLGVGVVGAREIVGAELRSQSLPQPGAAAVVEHPDALVRVVERQRADDGALEDRRLLIVGADEHVDERQAAAGRRARPGCDRRPATGPSSARHEHQADRRAQHGERLDQDEDQSDREVQRTAPAPAASRSSAITCSAT